MITQERETVVHRPLSDVFAALADATLWARLTPSRHGSHLYDVRIRGHDADLVFVHPPGWQQPRQIMLRHLEPERRIRVRYLRYPWPIRDFEATWTLEPAESSTRVHLRYRMRIGIPLLGNWVGRRLILPRFYGKNTDAVLEEMRTQLEAHADQIEPTQVSTHAA